VERTVVSRDNDSNHHSMYQTDYTNDKDTCNWVILLFGLVYQTA